MTLRRSSISVASRLDKMPPPATPCDAPGPSAADEVEVFETPRPMVERASPVIAETASRPPHPAARGPSPAANSRRPRSSSFEPTAFPSLPNRFGVDHADLHIAATPSCQSRRLEFNHHMAPGRNPIQIVAWSTKALARRKGGNRYVRPTATAPHLDSTVMNRPLSHVRSPVLPRLRTQRCAAANSRFGPRNEPAYAGARCARRRSQRRRRSDQVSGTG